MPKFRLLPVRFFALTPSLRHASEVSEVISSLCALGSDLVPTRYGYCEPLGERFMPSRLPDVGKGFEEGNMLMLELPAGKLNFSSYIAGYRFGTLSVELEADVADPGRIATSVRNLAVVLQPVLAFVHLLNEHDRERDIRRDMRVDAVDGASFGTFHKNLRYGLPEFYWGMLFGKPYTSLFGHERLKNMPAVITDEIAADLFYVRLTEDLRDCETHPARIAQARAQAKQYLGPGAFMHDKLDMTGLVPTLRFFDRVFAPRRIVPRLEP
jgi:hypothetical protein